MFSLCQLHMSAHHSAHFNFNYCSSASSERAVGAGKSYKNKFSPFSTLAQLVCAEEKV